MNPQNIARALPRSPVASPVYKYEKKRRSSENESYGKEKKTLAQLIQDGRDHLLSTLEEESANVRRALSLTPGSSTTTTIVGEYNVCLQCLLTILEMVQMEDYDPIRYKQKIKEIEEFTRGWDCNFNPTCSLKVSPGIVNKSKKNTKKLVSNLATLEEHQVEQIHIYFNKLLIAMTETRGYLQTCLYGDIEFDHAFKTQLKNEKKMLTNFMQKLIRVFDSLELSEEVKETDLETVIDEDFINICKSLTNAFGSYTGYKEYDSNLLRLRHDLQCQLLKFSCYAV